MIVLSRSYSRKLRNWHIQTQLIWNRGKGETQLTFTVKLEKETFNFINYTLPFGGHPLRNWISV